MGLKKRIYPLQLSATCGIIENFSYELPKGFEIIKYPEYKKINWDKLGWEREVKSKNNQLLVSSK